MEIRDWESFEINYLVNDHSTLQCNNDNNNNNNNNMIKWLVNISLQCNLDVSDHKRMTVMDLTWTRCLLIWFHFSILDDWISLQR
jgi:hypothetical protein